MLENTVKINMELTVPGQRLVQQLQLHNQEIEDIVEEGVNRGINEFFADKNIVDYIKEEVKSQITNVMSREILSYQMKCKITDLIHMSVQKAIDKHSDEFADKVSKLFE